MDVSPVGSGDIVSNEFSGGATPPSYPYVYTCSTAYTLTAQPNTGYAFDYWTVATADSTEVRTNSTTSVDLSTTSQTVTAYFIDPSSAAYLYFPHIYTQFSWQTEIALINTNASQAASGVLKGFSDSGQLIEIKDVYLAARGRRQVTIANEFVRHSEIGYIVFVSDRSGVQGYTKFYQDGKYRTAIPAVDEVNTSDIYITHIDSGDVYWTGLSLVNTTGTVRNLTINFNDGRSVNYPINAYQHRITTISDLFGGQPQKDIKSGVITNAAGVIGLELFGNEQAVQLDGILLTDNTVSTIYYPHVESEDGWWTGVVAYNPSASACNITVTPYSASGTVLPVKYESIQGKDKYVDAVKNLGLDPQTAWFKIDSTSPLNGFELFGGSMLGAYAEPKGTGATKQGVFPKIEKNGWTGIAFVNTEAGSAVVTLTAYNDSGATVATSTTTLSGYEKKVKQAEELFTQDIANATYIAFSSDKNVVGFQLNGSADGFMLDGLPALH